MDEYDKRRDLREFYRNKRKEEDQKVNRIFMRVLWVVLGAGVLWFIQRNPYNS